MQVVLRFLGGLFLPARAPLLPGFHGAPDSHCTCSTPTVDVLTWLGLTHTGGRSCT